MKKIFAIIIFLFLILNVNGQDPYFSQFHNTPLTLNPAYAGTTTKHRFSLASRVQWPSLPQSIITHAFSYDKYLPDARSGIGFLALIDKSGSAGFSSTQISGMYSFKINVHDKWMVSPSLQFGYGQRSLDPDRLVLGDQLGFTSILPVSSDPGIVSTTFNYFDFSSGLLLYNTTSWMGFSVFHMNQPVLSASQELTLPARFQIHGGHRIYMKNRFGFRVEEEYLTPSFVYFQQGAAKQLEFLFNYYNEPIMLGGSFRKRFTPEPYGGDQLIDAVIFHLGTRFPQFDISYSFDLDLAGFTPGGGAHEISIIANLSLLKRIEKINRQNRIIPCPSFPDDLSESNPYGKKSR